MHCREGPSLSAYNYGKMINAKYCTFDPPLLMFIKLLALLISNVLINFSALLCCRSLTSIHELKGENDLKRRFRVPASALKPSGQDRACLHRARRANV
jgi:hypothetical protein